MGFEQQKMCSNQEKQGFDEVWCTGFDPGLIVDDDRYEERKEHEVANDHERQIGDGTLAQVGEGDIAHGEQKNVGEQKRDADSDEKLIECGQARSQTLGRESAEDDGGCETDEGRPESHPNSGARKMPSVRTADDDAKEPCAASIDGACKNRTESSNSQKDHDGDGGADAAR